MTVQTDVPTTWAVEKLSDIAHVDSNLVDPKIRGHLPHIAPNHIESGTGRLLEYSTAAADGVISGKHLFKPGHILYSKIRPYLNKVTMVDFEGLCSADMYPVSTSENPRWLLYAMLSPQFVVSVSNTQTRTVLPKTNVRDLSAVKIPTPPSAEQQRIVDILEEQFSRLDAALASIRMVRAKAASFRRSLLQAAFNGEFSENFSTWEQTTIGQSCKVVSGATPKTTEPANWNGDVAWLTPADLSKNKSQVVSHGERFITRTGLESCSARLFPTGSVMFTSRAPIGYVAIAGQEMCTNQGFKTAVLGDAIRSEFLYWQLQHLTPEIRSRASGTTFLEISGSGFAATEIAIPPLDEQAAIVNVIEEQTSRLTAALIVADQLETRIAAERRSLLHAAFTGTLTAQWRKTHHG